MGMYNEVFAKCPKCGKYGYAQVRQYVLGFGGFYLDQPDTLEDLTNENLESLLEDIKDEYFVCGAGGHERDAAGCGHDFKFSEKKKDTERDRLLRKLTGEDEL